MKKFLESVAEYIIEKHPDGLMDICMVFPNRRSGSFFISYLREYVEDTVISPAICTIHEVLHGFTDYQQPDRLKLIAQLYQSFQKHSKSKESFDEFYYWGEVLLSDFDDIDKYLVDPVDLFRNLSELKEIDYNFTYLEEEQKEVLKQFWGSLGRWDEFKNKEEFLKIWNVLLPVYNDFKESLKGQGLAYDGMMLRELAKNLKKGEVLELPFRNYYFVGLNALNACEKHFLSYLKNQGKAGFFWDFDVAYMEDRKQEAGLFLRDNIRQFPPPDEFLFAEEEFSKTKNIEFIAVPSSQGQSQVIPDTLQKLGADFQEKFDNTAIVLADESLLFPTLGAIPEPIESVNVTMGYPVSNSGIFGFINVLAALVKSSRAKNGATSFYYPYVFDVLSHQLMAGVENEAVKTFIKETKKANLIYIPQESLYFSGLHKLIFQLPQHEGGISTYFCEILKSLHSHLAGNNQSSKLIQEILVSIYQIIEQVGQTIADVEKESGQPISDPIFFRLLFQHLNNINVAYEGEPLKGLQVIGILETRLLDFKNIIILGLNEDYWPKATSVPSFIPHNLHFAFGLPSVDQRDALQAYYFYRLVQRAKNLTATYNTVKETINRGELSRFGYQLIYDSPHEVKQKNIAFQLKSNKEKHLSAVSSPQLSEKLLRVYAEKPLSPSAINLYMNCKYRYYLRYVVGLPDKDEIREEVDGQMFGNIFHLAVEYLYENVVGQELSKEWFQKQLQDRKNIDSLVRQAISVAYFKKERGDYLQLELEGNVLLIYEYIKTYIRQLLKVDAAITPVEILACEENYHREVEFVCDGRNKKVKIGGNIDRLDRVGGLLRIIDYKTGNVKSLSFTELDEIFDPGKKNPKKEVFQALFYSYIINSYYPEAEVSAGVYDLKKLFGEPFSPLIKYNKKDLVFNPMVQEFKGLLQGLFAELFSANNEFTQTPHEEHCKPCPYKQICHRG